MLACETSKQRCRTNMLACTCVHAYHKCHLLLFSVLMAALTFYARRMATDVVRAMERACYGYGCGCSVNQIVRPKSKGDSGILSNVGRFWNRYESH